MTNEILTEAKRQKIVLTDRQVKDLERCIKKNELFIDDSQLIPFWIDVEKCVMRLMSKIDELYVQYGI